MKELEKQRNAYYGIRHLSAWTIRNIRFALDFKEEPAKVEKQFVAAFKSGPPEIVSYFKRNIRPAIQYMVANPTVGICCNFDGDDRWTWKEDK